MVRRTTLIPLSIITLLALPLQRTAGAAWNEGRTLPLSHGAPRSQLFVPNNGQFDPQVRFQMRGAGGTWWFTDDGIWLTVVRGPEGTENAARSTQHAARSVPLSGVALHLTFPGLNPAARLIAADPQPSKMNYFHGNEASRWRTDVPTFGSLVWHDLYPGLDLALGDTWSVSQGQSSLVQLRLEGANQVRVNDAGELLADTAIGSIRLPRLLTADGHLLTAAVDQDGILFRNSSDFHPPSGILRQVPSSFSLAPRVPDPLPGGCCTPSEGKPRRGKGAQPSDDPSDLLYSTYLGGSGEECESNCDIAIDRDGAAYITGSTYSAEFPTTPGAFDPRLRGLSDAFVTKLDASGSSLVYSTFLGGMDSRDIFGECSLSSCSIAIDAYDDAYIAGYTNSSDFPTTPGAWRTNCGPCGDAFVTKLSPRGNRLVYSTYLSGNTGNGAQDIAVNAAGEAYVMGGSYGNMPTTPGAFQPADSGYEDVFVTRLNASGSDLIYSTYLGGTSSDCYVDGFQVCSIAIDAQGAAYVTGVTYSTNFPTTPGAFDTTFNGDPGIAGSDAFVSKFSPDGTALEYSTFLGGTGCNDDFCAGGDGGLGIAVGADGSAYVTGYTDSADFPTTPGAFDTTFNSTWLAGSDVFVTRLNPDGSALVYSTFLGGRNNDRGFDIQVDATGAAYVTGFSRSPDFPSTPGAFEQTNDGWDAILTQVNENGTGLIYSTFLGGRGVTEGYALALDASGVVYLTGSTLAADFPTTAGAYDATYAGGRYFGDAFVSKLSPDLVRSHVAGITATYRPAGQQYRVGARVAIRDASGTAIRGAAVAVDVTLPNGQIVAVTRPTNAQGVATYDFLTGHTGTYTFTVTRVTRLGTLYDPAANVETSDSITVP